MTFAFNGSAVVRHVNLRKEGATDAKHVAADIKLQAIADASILDPFNDHLVHLLFNPAGDPRIVNLEPIALEGSIKHLALEFPEWGIALNDAEAKKFTFEPMSGRRVTMTFSVAIEPRGQQTAKLAEMLGEAVKISIGVEGDLLAGTASKAPPSENVKELAREIIAQGPEMVEAAKAVLKARKKFTDHLDKHGVTLEVRDGAGKTLITRKPQPKAAKAGPRPRGAGFWDPEELAKRIPLSSTGQCLVLRAVADGDCIELRLAKRDNQALLVETGFELRCGDQKTGSRVMLRDRGMILDAIHDVVTEIKGMFEWPDQLARAMTPTWPLSKVFRNIGRRSV
jgi:hypothetical protein